MHTQLLKQFSSILTLTLISLFFTSSTPGYDENGNDIDECAVYQPCPEGYTCLNTPGAYLCQPLEGYELEDELVLQEPSAGFYCISASCTDLGFCQAQCTKCGRIYAAAVWGKPTIIIGICKCSSIHFKPY